MIQGFPAQVSGFDEDLQARTQGGLPDEFLETQGTKLIGSQVFFKDLRRHDAGINSFSGRIYKGIIFDHEMKKEQVNKSR